MSLNYHIKIPCKDEAEFSSHFSVTKLKIPLKSSDQIENPSKWQAQNASQRLSDHKKNSPQIPLNLSPKIDLKKNSPQIPLNLSYAGQLPYLIWKLWK